MKTISKPTTPSTTPSVRSAIPQKAPATAPVVEKIAAPSVDLPWAGALLLGLAQLEKVKARRRHAADRVPLTQAAVTDATVALARAEASGPLEYSGVSCDGEAVARERLEAAELEAARARRIADALADAVEERRGSLRPLVEPGREGLTEWVEGELEALNTEFAAAIEFAVSIAAKAVALADASGATYLADPLMRARWPASLMRAEVAMRIGTLQGMTAPEATPQSARAGRLRALLEAARAAAEPVTTADRRAA